MVRFNAGFCLALTALGASLTSAERHFEFPPGISEGFAPGVVMKRAVILLAPLGPQHDLQMPDELAEDTLLTPAAEKPASLAMAPLSCAAAANFEASGTSCLSFVKSIQRSATIHLFQRCACFVAPRKQSRKSDAFFRMDASWILFGVPAADAFLSAMIWRDPAGSAC